MPIFDDVPSTNNGRALFGFYQEERPGIGDIAIPGTTYTTGAGATYDSYGGSWPYGDTSFMTVNSGETYYFTVDWTYNINNHSLVRPISICIRGRGIGTIDVIHIEPQALSNYNNVPVPDPAAPALGTFTFSSASEFTDVIIDLPLSLQDRQWFSYIDGNNLSMFDLEAVVTSGTIDLAYVGLLARPKVGTGVGKFRVDSSTWRTWGASNDSVSQTGRMKLLVAKNATTGTETWVRERTYYDPSGPSKPLYAYTGSQWEMIASMVKAEDWHYMPPAGSTSVLDDEIPTDPGTSRQFDFTTSPGTALDDTKHWSIGAYVDAAGTGYTFYIHIWDGKECISTFPFDPKYGTETDAQAFDRIWWGRGWFPIRPGVLAYVAYVPASNKSTMNLLYVTETTYTKKSIDFTDPLQISLGNSGVDTEQYMLDDETYIWHQRRITGTSANANLTAVKIPLDGSDPYRMWRKTWISGTTNVTNAWINEGRVPTGLLPLPGNRILIEWGALSGNTVATAPYRDVNGRAYSFSRPSILVYSVGASDITQVGSAPSRGATLTSDQLFTYVKSAQTCLSANRGYGLVWNLLGIYYFMPYHMSGDDLVWDPVEQILTDHVTTDRAPKFDDCSMIRYKDDIAVTGPASVEWSGTELAASDRYMAGVMAVMKTAPDGSHQMHMYISSAEQSFNRNAHNEGAIMNVKTIAMFCVAVFRWNWLVNARVDNGSYWAELRADTES